MTPMEKARDMALATARSIIRERHLEMTLENAERVLDEYARTNPEYLTGLWWLNTSDNQWKLFRREWKKALKSYEK